MVTKKEQRVIVACEKADQAQERRVKKMTMKDRAKIAGKLAVGCSKVAGKIKNQHKTWKWGAVFTTNGQPSDPWGHVIHEAGLMHPFRPYFWGPTGYGGYFGPRWWSVVETVEYLVGLSIDPTCPLGQTLEDLEVLSDIEGATASKATRQKIADILNDLSKRFLELSKP